MSKDFEIKRVVIGLSSLTLSTDSAQMDPSVQQQFPNCINAIVHLCSKSIEIKQKKIKQLRDEDDEEAFEDKDCERGAIYDEDDEDAIDLEESSEDCDDDEWDMEDEEDLDNDLYDTKIDKIDEILFVRDKIAELQSVGQTKILEIVDQNLYGYIQ